MEGVADGDDDGGDVWDGAGDGELVRYVYDPRVFTGLLSTDLGADSLHSGIHAYYFFRELYYACRAPTKTCPHCHGSLGRTQKRSVYASVPGEDDVAVPEMAEEGDSNDSKESFHSSQGRIALADEEPRPSSSKSPRPSTDDETARLV